MDAYRTLALEEAHRVRHAVLRRDTQKQVDGVGHGVPFQQADPLLLAQVPQELPDRLAEPAIPDLTTVLGDEHHMVFTVPLDVR